MIGALLPCVATNMAAAPLLFMIGALFPCVATKMAAAPLSIGVWVAIFA